MIAHFRGRRNGDYALSPRVLQILIEPFDAVVLDDRVAEDFARDRVEIFAGLHGDFEVFALANVFDAPMAESVERGANGLALRIEDRWFEGYVDAGFH
jgi:hypothetical protein